VADPDVVMAAAAGLLSARPWSVADLRRRLGALGYQAAIVATVIGRLVEMGYLDDERYAAAWVAARDRSHPRGASALRRELQRKGIDRPLIEAALAGREPGTHPTPVAAKDEAQEVSPDVVAARRLLERRRAALEREPDPRRRRQKAYALLARNGFDPDVCAEVASDVAT
jgi:regulatory protein